MVAQIQEPDVQVEVEDGEEAEAVTTTHHHPTIINLPQGRPTVHLALNRLHNKVGDQDFGRALSGELQLRTHSATEGSETNNSMDHRAVVVAGLVEEATEQVRQTVEARLRALQVHLGTKVPDLGRRGDVEKRFLYN